MNVPVIYLYLHIKIIDYVNKNGLKYLERHLLKKIVSNHLCLPKICYTDFFREMEDYKLIKRLDHKKFLILDLDNKTFRQKTNTIKEYLKDLDNLKFLVLELDDHTLKKKAEAIKEYLIYFK